MLAHSWARVVFVFVCVLAARTSTAAPLRLATLDIEIDAQPGWKLGPGKTGTDTVLIKNGEQPVFLRATPGSTCELTPGAERPARCPTDFTCAVGTMEGVDILAYCTHVPGGTLQLVRQTYPLETLDLMTETKDLAARARDALTKLRSTTPWVQHAEISGLDIGVPGPASWELSTKKDFRPFGRDSETVDRFKRRFPAPEIYVQFAIRDRSFDCDALRSAWKTDLAFKETDHAGWPEGVPWLMQLDLPKSDGTGVVRAQATCARTRNHTVLLMAEFEGSLTYLEVVRSVLAASDAGAALQSDAAPKDSGSGDDDRGRKKTARLHVSRFYLGAFSQTGEGADDRYGGRIGMEMWADLDEERSLSPMFGFGLSGSANSAAQFGFDARLAYGGGLIVGPVGLALLATGGVDRVSAADGLILYGGAEALASLRLGGVSVGAAAQWNTNEYRSLLQLAFTSGLVVGGEWIRYRDAMVPTDMLGIYIGAGPP